MCRPHQATCICRTEAFYWSKKSDPVDLPFSSMSTRLRVTLPVPWHDKVAVIIIITTSTIITSTTIITSSTTICGCNMWSLEESCISCLRVTCSVVFLAKRFIPGPCRHLVVWSCLITNVFIPMWSDPARPTNRSEMSSLRPQSVGSLQAWPGIRGSSCCEAPWEWGHIVMVLFQEYMAMGQY